jgi:hypothetical protein
MQRMAAMRAATAALRYRSSLCKGPFRSIPKLGLWYLAVLRVSDQSVFFPARRQSRHRRVHNTSPDGMITTLLRRIPRQLRHVNRTGHCVLWVNGDGSGNLLESNA